MDRLLQNKKALLAAAGIILFLAIFLMGGKDSPSDVVEKYIDAVKEENDDAEQYWTTKIEDDYYNIFEKLEPVFSYKSPLNETLPFRYLSKENLVDYEITKEESYGEILDHIHDKVDGELFTEEQYKDLGLDDKELKENISTVSAVLEMKSGKKFDARFYTVKEDGEWKVLTIRYEGQSME
jgi:hypothetical protein